MVKKRGEILTNKKKKKKKQLANRLGILLTFGLLFILIAGGIWLSVTVVGQLGNNDEKTETTQVAEGNKETQTNKVLFVSGWALGPNDYRTITDNLAAQGYEIIYHNPSFNDTSDYQRIIDVWTEDLQTLAGDDKVIAIGHSTGGGAVTNFCSIDESCVAGINLDGTPAYDQKLPVPFLYLQGDIGHYCDEPCLEGRDLMEKMIKESGGTTVKIPGILHLNFTDQRTQYYYQNGFLGEKDGRKEINAAINQFLSHTF